MSAASTPGIDGRGRSMDRCGFGLSVCRSVGQYRWVGIRVSVRVGIGGWAGNSRSVGRQNDGSNIERSLYPLHRLVAWPAVRPSVRPAVRPSIRPTVRLDVRPYVPPSIRLAVRPAVPRTIYPIRPSLYPFVRPSVRSPVPPSVRPPRLSLCPSLCPSVPPYLPLNYVVRSNTVVWNNKRTASAVSATLLYTTRSSRRSTDQQTD